MNNKILLFAWCIANIAMLGSLYLSEIMGFVPCTLCWYQRILMYPLVILLGIAAFREDKTIYIYTLPSSLLGAAIALYHYITQKLPVLSEIAACSTDTPCSGEYINWFGFITIPFLSLVAFIIISVLMFMLYKQNKSKEDEAA